jgi:hypothetical protein
MAHESPARTERPDSVNDASNRPALVRRVFKGDGDAFRVVETWNTKHPDCPFVMVTAPESLPSRDP